MATSRMSALPALRRQHLLAEFAGLKQACPEGVVVTLTPGDASLWSGVIFVREGPYSTAILRFQISFPDSYPSLPPLVTFSTDMFHPLITPLTTYMYTTDIQDNGTVSATDDERLPPGGFSLRHGFPDWFGRGTRSRQTSGQHAPGPAETPPRPTAAAAGSSGSRSGSKTTTPATGGTTSSSATATPGATSFLQTTSRDVPVYDVLRYIYSTFDSAEVLDSVALEAAGNPGAWHAWRAYRRKQGKVFAGDGGKAGGDAAPPQGPGAAGPGPSQQQQQAAGAQQTRQPGEWNWEGVWEERVKRGIAASLSEAVLFGSAGGSDEVINFLNLEDAEIEGIKGNLLRTLGASV